MDTWEKLYYITGTTDFVHFVTSPTVQSALLPVKLVFIFFTIFFLGFVIYFYITSSYVKTHFLEDTTEFLSWQPYGLRQINKRWAKIAKRLETGNESEYKLAIVEADDFLYKMLEDKGYNGENFEELVANAGQKIMPSPEDILSDHTIRNSIVYDSNYVLDITMAKEILRHYEMAIKNL